MKKLIAIPVLAGAVLTLAPIRSESHGITVAEVRGYVERMGMQPVPHPKSANALVVSRAMSDDRGRLDLYIDIRENKTLVLTAYAKIEGRYFNLARASDSEKLFRRLLETNHHSFATFFVDEQGDIGARFTFTTENGVGFESFRVAATELLRISEEYAPVLEENMKK
ncbi:MAG TPA: YbjN domain-containing protein [Blastocatellia bacterium]|nr:YbjN domain-containing protein [Blastocatellia bacterium]